MTSSRVYHTAYLVPNLAEAIPIYERMLGVTFKPPKTTTFGRLAQVGFDGPFTCSVTYSIEGPAHIELMETSGPGIFDPQAVDFIHHTGVWSADPLAEAEQMARFGFAWEASCYAPDGTIPIVFVRRGNVRLELVTESRQQGFADWMAGIEAEPR